MTFRNFCGTCDPWITSKGVFSALRSGFVKSDDRKWQDYSAGESFSVGYAYSPPTYGVEVISPAGRFRHISFIFIGLLRNRRDISGYLTGNENELDQSSTAQFLAIAYAELGQRLFGLMTGEYSCVIWDNKDKQLLLLRDKFGQYPLFYLHSKSAVAFASRPDKFGSIGHPPEIELSDIARLNIPSAARITDRPWFFKRIQAVQPGHFVTFNGKALHEKRYFNWQLQSEISKLSVEECNEQMRSLLRKSVKSFVENANNPGLLFSGGLDSSALAALMIEQLPETGEAIFAMTSADFKAKNISSDDDASYVRDFAINPQLDIHEVRPDADTGPFSDMDRLIANNYNPLLMYTHYQYTAFGSKASANNVDMVLDGVFGERGTSFRNKDMLLQEFMKGKLGWLARSLRQRSEIYQRPVWKQFAQDIVRPLVRSRKEKTSPWLEFLNPAFLNGFNNDNVREKIQADRLSHNDQIIASIKNHGRAGSIPGFMGLDNNVQRVFPFLDESIIEFAASAPAEAHIQDGYPRSLIRGAMAPYWSERQRTRISKSPFSPDFLSRFENQRMQQQAEMAAIPKGDPVREIINVDHISQLLGRDDLQKARVHFLIQAVYLVVFLRQWVR